MLPVQTFIIGVGGTIYNDLPDYLTNTLKIPNAIVTRHIHKIQANTWSRGHQLITTRRSLENKSSGSQ